MLINSIDRTLNGIWQDTSNRPIFTSFAIYWLILTLGPLLIGTSIMEKLSVNVCGHDARLNPSGSGIEKT